MSLEYIRDELARDGWEDLGPSSHMGIDFDLVGSRRWLKVSKWNVLVKILPRLDGEVASVWKANFEAINKGSQSWLWGQMFLLCLLFGEVSEDIQQRLSRGKLKLIGGWRRGVKGGGGNVIVADLRNKQVYGKVPLIPVDVRRFSDSVKKILSHACDV